MALLPAEVALAKTIRLQTVDLTDMRLSTEGGEAILYEVGAAGHRFCRIEATHYGETGKAILVFDFGSKLYGAVRSEYHYELPIYMSAAVKATLTERTTLASREGREALLKDFVRYKNYFDARHIAKCSGQ